VELYELDPCTDARWVDFLDRHPESSIFHSPEWLAALRRTYGYEPVVFTTSPRGSEITNGQPFCRVNSWLTGRRLVSIPFSDHAALLMTGTDAECLSHHLQQAIQNAKCKYVELRPSGAEAAPSEFRESSSFFRHRLRLDGDIDGLFHNFHKSCVQRKIQRAVREKLEYTEGRSDRLIHQFRGLLLKTHRRHHLPPQPFSWFENLSDCLGNRLKIRIASKDGRPIAGMITLSFKRSMVYKYGCSDERYHQLGGMAFLFWKAIQDAKMAGCSELDMGRSDVDNPGLITFKEHWGAERSTLNYWRYPVAKSSSATQWELKTARKIFTFAPTFALTTAGRLLYRHVG
jgi:hypothetical protein